MEATVFVGQGDGTAARNVLGKNGETLWGTSKIGFTSTQRLATIESSIIAIISNLILDHLRDLNTQNKTLPIWGQSFIYWLTGGNDVPKFLNKTSIRILKADVFPEDELLFRTFGAQAFFHPSYPPQARLKIQLDFEDKSNRKFVLVGRDIDYVLDADNGVGLLFLEESNSSSIGQPQRRLNRFLDNGNGKLDSNITAITLKIEELSPRGEEFPKESSLLPLGIYSGFWLAAGQNELRYVIAKYNRDLSTFEYRTIPVPEDHNKTFNPIIPPSTKHYQDIADGLVEEEEDKLSEFPFYNTLLLTKDELFANTDIDVTAVVPYGGSTAAKQPNRPQKQPASLMVKALTSNFETIYKDRFEETVLSKINARRNVDSLAVIQIAQNAEKFADMYKDNVRSLVEKDIKGRPLMITNDENAKSELQKIIDEKLANLNTSELDEFITEQIANLPADTPTDDEEEDPQTDLSALKNILGKALNTVFDTEIADQLRKGGLDDTADRNSIEKDAESDLDTVFYRILNNALQELQSKPTPSVEDAELYFRRREDRIAEDIKKVLAPLIQEKLEEQKQERKKKPEKQKQERKEKPERQKQERKKQLKEQKQERDKTLDDRRQEFNAALDATQIKDQLDQKSKLDLNPATRRHIILRNIDGGEDVEITFSPFFYEDRGTRYDVFFLSENLSSAFPIKVKGQADAAIRGIYLRPNDRYKVLVQIGSGQRRQVSEEDDYLLSNPDVQQFPGDDPVVRMSVTDIEGNPYPTISHLYLETDK